MTKDTTPSPEPAPSTADTGTNGLAIASLVLGIVSFTGFGPLTGVPAIITGFMALKKGQKERGMSIAGIVMGSIATLLTLLFIGFIILLILLGVMSDTGQGPSEYPMPMPGFDMPMESSRT